MKLSSGEWEADSARESPYVGPVSSHRRIRARTAGAARCAYDVAEIMGLTYNSARNLRDGAMRKLHRGIIRDPVIQRIIADAEEDGEELVAEVAATYAEDEGDG